MHPCIPSPPKPFPELKAGNILWTLEHTPSSGTAFSPFVFFQLSFCFLLLQCKPFNCALVATILASLTTSWFMCFSDCLLLNLNSLVLLRKPFLSYPNSSLSMHGGVKGVSVGAQHLNTHSRRKMKSLRSFSICIANLPFHNPRRRCQDAHLPVATFQTSSQNLPDFPSARHGHVA